MTAHGLIGGAGARTGEEKSAVEMETETAPGEPTTVEIEGTLRRE